MTPASPTKATRVGREPQCIDHRTALAGLATFTIRALVCFFIVLRPRLKAIGLT